MEANAHHPDHKLPKLFDFEYYKEKFEKIYDSPLEELSRKRLFFSGAFKSFVSGVNYEFRRMWYFLAINEFSDRSPEELARMLNRVMAEDQRRRASELEGHKSVSAGEAGRNPALADKADDGQLPEFILDENEDVEAEVLELMQRHANEPGFKDLISSTGPASSSRRRKKREVATREFNFDRLIAGESPEDKEERPSPKMVISVKSNNPNYVPIEWPSRGLREDKEEVEWFSAWKFDWRPIVRQVSDCLGSGRVWPNPKRTRPTRTMECLRTCGRQSAWCTFGTRLKDVVLVGPLRR